MDWQTISTLGGVLSAFGGLLIGAVKWILEKHLTQLDKRFESLEKVIGDDMDAIKQIERDLTELKISLPREYVRREDWIHFSGVIDAKLDGIYQKVQNIAEGGCAKRGHCESS